MSTDSVNPDSKYGTEGVCESGMVDPRSKTHTTKSNAAANGKLCNPLPADVKLEAEQVRGGVLLWQQGFCLFFFLGLPAPADPVNPKPLDH